jgi:hypothetical protein
MLVKSARALTVAPTALLPDDNEPAPRSPAILSLMSQLRGVDDLVECYSRIKSPRLRRALLQLARSLAASNEPADEKDKEEALSS